MWLCLSAFWIVFNLILYFEIHSDVSAWLKAEQELFFTGVKIFSLRKVRIRCGRYFSLGVYIFSLKYAGLDHAKSFTSYTLAKKSPQKITSESTWHKPFHSGSLFWSANLDYILMNVFLLSCTNVASTSVLCWWKRPCSNFHVFLCASMHSGSFHDVPVTGLMT